MKPRIPVSSPQPPIQSPFAALEIAGLPQAPPEQPTPTLPVRHGRIVLRREKAQRGGKTVVIVSGFESSLSNSEIAELARRARQHCGCGGTVRDREIELQGDQPAKVRAFFVQEGFTVGGV